MAINTFGQYGLQFVAPEFNLGGLGKLHVNKVRRDELIDLARKKKLQDKYGADFKLAGAPVAPPVFEDIPITEVPMDPYFNKFGATSMQGDGGYKISSERDIVDAQNTYMDELSRYVDQGMPVDTQRLAYLQQRKSDIERAIQGGMQVEDQLAEVNEAINQVQLAGQPPKAKSYGDEEAEYQAELDKYNQEKAKYKTCKYFS